MKDEYFYKYLKYKQKYNELKIYYNNLLKKSRYENVEYNLGPREMLLI
jgi:hypothetical protein